MMMEFIPNPHKIEHPAGVHMLDNQSRITLWQTEPAALLYAQMLQGCLRITIGLPEENKQIIAKITELCAEVKA
jgi:hypothetical protein